MIEQPEFAKHVENINKKILEPTCGEGIFLTEILKRRIKDITDEEQIFTALSNLYGIEIQHDNVTAARENLFDVIKDKVTDTARAREIIDANLIEGDFLLYPAVKIKDWQTDETFSLDEIVFQRGFGKVDENFVIIGNPPYQEDPHAVTGQARPIYHKFIDTAKKFNPDCLLMIIPSRWFSGGMGLDDFRKNMLQDKRIMRIVDYANAKDCFPDQDISGGVCYFIWSKDYHGDCKFENVFNDKSDIMTRPLDEFPVLVRYNRAISIIRKVISFKEKLLTDIISSLMPFGLNSNYRGTKNKISDEQLTLYASNSITYINGNEIKLGFDYVDKFKLMLSKIATEHACEPGSDGKFRVFSSSIRVLKPNEVCTHSYFLIGKFNKKLPAENLLKYLKTRFVRFLVLMSVSSINLSKLVFIFVPLQNFCADSDIDWTKSVAKIDAQLYKKYGLSYEEVDFIESKVRAMD